MRGRLLDVAFTIIYDDERRHYFADRPERATWGEIVSDPELGLQRREDGGLQVNLRAVARRLQWLRDRVEDDSSPARRIDEISNDLASGRNAAAWFDALCDSARQSERRRTRLRNALVHGGPLAEASLTAALPFAEYMASEAIGTMLDAQLQGESLTDFLLARTAHLNRMRRRLADDVPPHDALFWDRTFR